MNPRIEAKSVSEDGDVLKFTLTGVNVSIANSIRRTILSDIPCAVFKTSPNEENTANIILNTSRFNNEIIKQRLSCIPIHINDLQMPLKNYLMEVNVENLTDTMLYVTTKDFKIKNLTTGDYLSEKDTQAIFPPSDQQDIILISFACVRKYPTKYLANLVILHVNSLLVMLKIAGHLTSSQRAPMDILLMT